MKKLMENVVEMSMFFSRMAEDGKLIQPEPDTVSIFSLFKERVEDWATEFETVYRDVFPYQDAIKVIYFTQIT